MATPTPRGAATQMPPLSSIKLTQPTPAANPNDLVSRAIVQAQNSILPSVQSNQAQQAAAAAQSQQQQSSTQDAYAALSNILKGIGPAIGGAYHNAALDEGMLAKGFADGLAHLQAQAGAQTNQALGAGTPQAAQANTALGGQGSQDAVYALGGYIPATSLGREGAAFQAAAAQLPATAAGLGMQSIQGLQAKQALTDAGFDAKQADLMARIPGLAQTALDHLNSQASLNDYRTATTTERAAHDAALEGQAAANAKALAGYRTDQYNLGVDRINAAAAKTAAAAAPRFDASRSRALGYRVDQYGNQIGDSREVLPGFRFNAAGDVVKAPSSSALKRPGGMTQSQWTAVYGKVNKQADDFYHGVPQLLDSHNQVVRPQQDPVMYQDAFARIKETHPTMANKRIYAILNLYYQPGEGGRPLPVDRLRGMNVVKSPGPLGVTGATLAS